MIEEKEKWFCEKEEKEWKMWEEKFRIECERKVLEDKEREEREWVRIV